MFVRLRVFALVAVALAAAPAVSNAQSNAQRSAPAAGPRLETTATALRRTTQPVDSTTLVQRSRQSAGKPVALMIVGGAAIVLGAVIGDEAGTLFMIGGAVALLIGLYQYLQ